MNPTRTQVFARRSRVATHGFSLIEVLIAVLLLGIGLLGLASVFPVVISQQRDATDVIRGGVASAAIRDQIRANPDIVNELLSQDGYADADEPDLDGDRVPNDPDDNGLDSDGDGVPDGFDPSVGSEPIFGMDPAFNLSSPNIGTDGSGRYNPLNGYSYLWEADWNWSSARTLADRPNTVAIGGGLLTTYRQTGGVRFRDPVERAAASISNTQADLPVQARLYPRPYSAVTNGGTARLDGPQYVWDFVPRRQPNGDLQIAIFLRRISSGIRVGAGQTLSAVLRDGANSIFPVSRDQTTGELTTDGSGEYAVPMSALAVPVPTADYPARPESRVSPDPDNDVLSDGIRVSESGGNPQVGTATQIEDLLPLAAVGQKFVDNLGVVRTVVEVLSVNDGEGYIDLRVEPAFVRNAVFPAFADALNLAGSGYSGREAARIGKLRQIVFTPQIPVDVFTMEFSK